MTRNTLASLKIFIPPGYTKYIGVFSFCLFCTDVSCLFVNFFFIKDFSGTNLLRILKLGAYVRYDKLYCVLKNQPHIAYQSLYPFFFLTKFSVVNEQCINAVFILWPYI